jgi:D-3-phosphoglycerate dehydrogenase
MPNTGADTVATPCSRSLMDLDSFAMEPMTAGHPFQGEKHFILSPHIGGVTSDAYVNMGVGAAKNLLAVLARTPGAAAVA